MAKQLVVDPKKCVSCRTCELVCSFRHNEEFNPRLSNVSVFHYEEAAITVPIMCMQCDEACCAAIWPANGVLLRLPLKPDVPAVAQQRTLPETSVIVTFVLLKDTLM